MAVSYIGQYRYPVTDNQNVTANAFTLATAGLGAETGDVVLVLVAMPQSTAGTWSVTTTGGQTWVEDVDSTTGTTKALYHCVFNGTWAADPVFTSTNSATTFIGWATVWRGVDTASVWDVAPAGMQSDGSDPVDATWDTATNGAKAFVFSSVSDNDTCTLNNSMVAPAGSGNVYWQSSGGSDGVLVIGQKTVATAGAVGATTCDYSAAETYGWAFHAALKPGATTFERAASVDVTVADVVASGRNIVTARSADLSATADVQAAAQFYTIFERSASFDAETADIQVAGARVGATIERAADFTVATADVQAAAQFYTTFERAAELSATADVQAAYIRDLPRAAELSATADVQAVAQFYSIFERAAELSATADVQTVAQFYSIFERASELAATADVQAAYVRDLQRAAELSATADVVASGSATGAAVERAADLDAVADVVAAGARHSKYQVRNLVATPVSTSQIDLTWDDVAGLAGETYDIERGGSVIETDWATTSYSDDGLDPDTEYVYRVRAVAEVGA